MTTKRELTLPAIEVQQDGSKLIITKMKAGDLADFTRIDPFDTSKDSDDPEQGYQRPPEMPRIKKFANWVRSELDDNGKVRMPTALLLSARDSDITYLPNGTITLKSTNKLPLIDGQHRRRGFEYAIHDKGLTQLEDYEVPVVILLGIDKVGEMKQFRTVNGEQKSVRTDLVNMILTQLVEREGVTAVKQTDHWKVVSSHVVIRLNEDVDGPWYDRIVMPDKSVYSKDEIMDDESLRHRRTARATSFITSLKPIEAYLENVKPENRSIDERATDLFDVVDAFWSAVRELMPECFDEADDYVLLKTPGIFSLHRLCLRVMKDMHWVHLAWTKDEFRTLLENCEELQRPDYWFVGNDESDRGDAAKYGSMKGFMELSDLLYESLHS